MDLPWGDARSKKFITNVGLVTSVGPHGQNVMAVEWTHHISYSPGMILICINPKAATHENIVATKEFGVSLCAVGQAMFSSVAGNNSGRDVDKIKLLEALGFSFYQAKNMKPLMVQDAALNVECKLIKQLDLGSHTMFVGEVIEATQQEDKQPLALHAGQYWQLTEALPKPSDEQREKIKELVEKFKK